MPWSVVVKQVVTPAGPLPLDGVMVPSVGAGEDACPDGTARSPGPHPHTIRREVPHSERFKLLSCRSSVVLNDCESCFSRITKRVSDDSRKAHCTRARIDKRISPNHGVRRTI